MYTRREALACTWSTGFQHHSSVMIGPVLEEVGSAVEAALPKFILGNPSLQSDSLPIARNVSGPFCLPIRRMELVALEDTDFTLR